MEVGHTVKATRTQVREFLFLWRTLALIKMVPIGPVPIPPSRTVKGSDDARREREREGKGTERQTEAEAEIERMCMREF